MTSMNRRIARLFEPAHRIGNSTMWKARKGADALAVYQLAVKLGWQPRGELWFDPSESGSTR